MNYQAKTTQQPMSGISFNVMRWIMSLRKRFRNIDEEIRLAGLKAGDVVVDFGCGLGFNTIPAAQIVGVRGKVYALDISPDAIAVIMKEMRKNCLNNIETLLSNGEIPLEDQTVDIVYLHNTLPLIVRKKEALREIQRVLKVHGKFSYMSRKVSRTLGNNSMNNQSVREYLETELHCQLIQEKNGHFIFERKQ